MAARSVAARLAADTAGCNIWLPSVQQLSQACWPSHLTQTLCVSSAAASDAKKPAPDSSSIDRKEVEKFRALGQEWWSQTGPMRGLHALTPARVHFIRDAATHCFDCDISSPQPLQGLSVLDVGCGGGILAEALAREGANVSAIDVSAESVAVATAHAAKDSGLAANLTYECQSAEALVTAGKVFDVVVASEVIEHVKTPPAFVDTLAALRQPKGCVVITTLNRTPESYMLAIVAAEKILGLAPDGAHDWNKFLTPDELALLFAKSSLPMQLLAGLQMDPLTGKWWCTSNYGVNYAAMFARTNDTVP